MGTGSDMPAGDAAAASPREGSLWSRPSSQLGRWSVGLGAAFVILNLINSFVFMPSTVEIPWREIVLPFYGVGILVCGLAAGIVGLSAVIRRRERSWLVWLTLMPGILVLALLLGEFLVPH